MKFFIDYHPQAGGPWLRSADPSGKWIAPIPDVYANEITRLLAGLEMPDNVAELVMYWFREAQYLDVAKSVQDEITVTYATKALETALTLLVLQNQKDS